jgi:hypothetical protein
VSKGNVFIWNLEKGQKTEKEGKGLGVKDFVPLLGLR